MTVLRWFSLLVVACFLLAGFWFASIIAFDRHYTQYAMSNLDLLKTNQALAWEFNSSTELEPGNRNALADLKFEGGRLKATAANTDPILSVNLHNKWLDAKRYSRLQIRLFSDHQSSLQLFHWTPFEAMAVIGSLEIPVSVGWQIIDLDLKSIPWEHLDYSQKGTATRVTPSKWGGKGGVISELRIDPVNTAQSQFMLDYVRLSGSYTGNEEHLKISTKRVPTEPEVRGKATGVESIAAGELVVYTFSSTAVDFETTLEWLRKHRDKPLILEDTALWQTPEMKLLAYQKIYKAAPAAAVFPVETDISDSAMERLASDSVVPEQTLEYASYIFSIILLCAIAGFFIRNKHLQSVPIVRRAVLELAALIGLMIAGWVFFTPMQRYTLDYVLPVLMLAFVLLLAYRWPAEEQYAEKYSHRITGAATVTLIITLAVLGSILLVSWSAGTLENSRSDKLLQSLLTYPFWAAVQQYLLGPVLARRFYVVLPWAPAAALAVATVFGFLHLPNFSLMIVTFVLGWVWVVIYLRYGTIIPQSIGHGVLAVCFKEFAPPELLHSFEVGPVFFNLLGS